MSLALTVILGFVGFVILLLSTVYLWFRNRYSYWKKKGVFGPPPTFPSGNMDGVLTKRKHLGDSINEIYRVHRKEPFVGIYSVHMPALVINDLELMKQILIKDYQHFNSRGGAESGDDDPMAAHLFNLSGERWRSMRTKLSPTFTSGKMRMMFDNMAETQVTMLKHLEKESAKRDVFDVKRLAAHFTTDAIANTIFGVECNSFDDPHNQFRKAGIEGISPTRFTNRIGLAMQMLAPEMKVFLGLHAHAPELAEFFTKLVEDTIEHREKNDVSRDDFMQLLIQMKNNQLRDDDGSILDLGGITIKEMVAQTYIFFVAGFETSSTAAACALYHLALCPEYQVRARKEVLEVLAKHGGKCTYDSLREMTFLTMVIEETMRLFPGLSFHARRCTMDYKIPGSDLILEKGNLVFIPVMGIHTDPEIYENPLNFDPERFSPEAKAARHPMTWMPFGNGPRICIAARYGMMMVRLAVVAILAQYEVQPCKQTQVPFVIDTRSFPLTPRDGIWLKLKKTQMNI